MLTYLLIYVIAHLLSAVLIGIMLGRLRLVPTWAAWAFALTSPFTLVYFSLHDLEVRYVVKFLICALWVVGAAPAARVMFNTRAWAYP
jgi:hypothetical protein